MCIYIHIYIYTRVCPHISMCGLPVTTLADLAFIGSMQLLFTAFVFAFVSYFVSAFGSSPSKQIRLFPFEANCLDSKATGFEFAGMDATSTWMRKRLDSNSTGWVRNRLDSNSIGRMRNSMDSNSIGWMRNRLSSTSLGYFEIN